MLAWALPASLRAADPTPAQLQFFDAEVYPLLESKCFKCHGAEEKLKGGLRLTSHAGLLRGGELGPAFDVASPERSLLLEMISYKDEEHEMPPKAKLPDAAREILAQWLAMGAPYNPDKEILGDPSDGKHEGIALDDAARNWWAYRPVTSPAIPETGDAEWCENPIDALLYDRLRKEGLEPNPSAVRQVLVRRAYYDLTGLPPTPAQVRAFVDDRSATAWEDLIDELLARPQYGEKWARHWLDVVRYAETNGFERDGKKPFIWRYRDYVIKAFNEDKPYDQFIIEQLAGDEIDAPTFDSIAATGFHRLMQWDDEPADRKQHVYDVLADNVAMASEAFLATSLGCARCHDHKADPISQKDYYSFMAFMHGVKHYTKQGTLVPWAGSGKKEAEFEERRAMEIAKLERKAAALEARIRAYLVETGRLRPATEKVQTLLRDARDGSTDWRFTTRAPAPDWLEVGFVNKSWVRGPGGFGRKNTPGAIIGSAWESDDIWMRANFGLKVIPKTLTLDIRHDEDVKVYLNGIEVFAAKGHTRDYKAVALDGKAIDALQTGKNVVAVHCKQTAGGQYIDIGLRSGIVQSRDMEKIVKAEGTALIVAMDKRLGKEAWGNYQRALKEAEQLRDQPAGDQINAVVENGRAPQQLHVHIRGSAHAPGDPVVPAFPAVLSGTDAPKPAVIPASYVKDNSSGRRRALAEWVASPENPLTARVIMNRLWQHHFGRGIVPSASDFGKLGERPTHPELLDHLASELVRSDWSLKAMHRHIMTSQAYRMASTPREEALAVDPENNLFWRFDMRRLTAEEIRDSILAISGNLNLKAGGESVFPPLPEAVLATASRPHAAWGQSPPQEASRRSIYAHVKRSLRIPMLADHDQADTDSPCAVRFATTVPTQALGMLNSRFVNSQAAIFADRLREEAGDDPEAQVETAFTLALQRTPAPGEVRQSLDFMQRLQSKAGLTPDEALDRFALLTLNLNEFVYLD